MDINNPPSASPGARPALLAESPGADHTGFVLDVNGRTQPPDADFDTVIYTDRVLSADTDQTIGWTNDIALDDSGPHPIFFVPGTDELVYGESVDNAAKTMTVRRGFGDTVPASVSVAAATPLFLAGYWYDDGSVMARTGDRWARDLRGRSSGDVVALQALTRTAHGILDAASAPTDDVTIAERVLRPWPPGDVVADDNSTPNDFSTGAVNTTWSRRARDGDPQKFFGATDQPLEVGQDSVIKIYGTDKVTSIETLLATYSTTTAFYDYKNSDEITAAGRGYLYDSLRLTFGSTLSGRDSHQSYEQIVTRGGNVGSRHAEWLRRYLNLLGKPAAAIFWPNSGALQDDVGGYAPIDVGTPSYGRTALVDSAGQGADGSVLLDGSSDYWSVPGSSDWQPGAGSFTALLWCQVSGSPADAYLYDCDESSAGAWDLRWQDGITSLRADLRDSGGTSVAVSCVAPEGIALAAIVVDRATDQLRAWQSSTVYGDDTAVADISALGSVVPTNGLFIGAQKGGSNLFPGNTEVGAIIPYALTPAELQAIFDGGLDADARVLP